MYGTPSPVDRTTLNAPHNLLHGAVTRIRFVKRVTSEPLNPSRKRRWYRGSNYLTVPPKASVSPPFTIVCVVYIVETFTEMEENQRVKGSRAAYCSHVTRTFRKIDEIMEKEDPLPDPQVAKLTSVLEQLTQKKEVLY